MSFNERMVAARAAEDQVQQELIAAGWRADRFGQALLTEPCRNALKGFRTTDGHPSLIRWFPDLIVYRDATDPRTPQERVTDVLNGRHASTHDIILLDVKADTGRENFAIEIAAIETCEKFMADFYTPCWFIFPGLLVVMPMWLRDRDWRGNPGGGSGTPFMLIERDQAVHLSKIYPQSKPSS